MITMVMGIDKSQVKSLVKVTTGSFAFRRTPALQAGFKTIDYLCVGASGGRTTGTANSYYGGGGGGGGSIRKRRNIIDLPELSSGLVGAKGADAGGGIDAEKGGHSNFNSDTAYGGQGANVSMNMNYGRVIPAAGGDGGGNSDVLGSGGQGGTAHGDYGYDIPATSPTTGTYVDQGNGNGGGKGGGGGRPRSNRSGYTNTATAGASGNSTTITGPGGAVISSNYGGWGGGADIASITGVQEYYGSGNGGVVAYKLT